MTVTPSRIMVNGTGKYLDTTEVDTGLDGVVHREGVFIGDAEFPENRVGVAEVGVGTGNYSLKVVPQHDFMLSVAEGNVPAFILQQAVGITVDQRAFLSIRPDFHSCRSTGFTDQRVFIGSHYHFAQVAGG